MRVALSTIGKFHTFDLARQLERHGALAAIFSGYPRFKLTKERLPREKIKTFPYLHAPYMRFPPRSASVRKIWEWQDKLWFDAYVAGRLPACDVFCGLSGSALRSGLKAKSQGAKYICDRGSSHIRFQERILREEYARQGVPFSGIDARIIAQEEAEYEAADLVTVPSSFALRTFVECGVPRKKIRLVPYGVDLGAFYPCPQRDDTEFRILFAGNLSVRKSTRDLVEAFLQLRCERKRLIFAGSISSELADTVGQWGRNSRISVLGQLSQARLREVMGMSHVLVLPSVEEGLALVQAQAMACGCPVIASENTGASNLFTDGIEGFIVPIRNPEAIAARLQLLADSTVLRERMSQAALARVRAMGGWEEYGDRMLEVFSEVVAGEERTPLQDRQLVG